MRGEFSPEAKKYQVLPLDASVAARIIVAPRPNITAGRTEFVTRPMVGLPQGDSPFLLDASTITADIDVPPGGRRHDPHVGRPVRRLRLYLQQGKPVFLWNLVDLERIKWEAPDALAPGRHSLEFDFKYDGSASARCCSTTSAASADRAPARSRSRVVARKPMERTCP